MKNSDRRPSAARALRAAPRSSSTKRMQSHSRRQKKIRIARFELVTGTTRTGRTSNTGLPRSRSRSPLRERAVAPSVQRSPRARNSCRRAFLVRELRTRSWSFSFGWYRDMMQLGESTPSAMHVEGPEPRHGLTVVYRQKWILKSSTLCPWPGQKRL